MPHTMTWPVLFLYIVASASRLKVGSSVSFCRFDHSNNSVNGTGVCKDTIDIFASLLDSDRSALQYDYNRFNFCRSDDASPSLNLGQLLSGNRLQNLPYQLRLMKEESCREVCTRKYDTSRDEDKESLNMLIKGLALDYQHHWVVDDIPVTWCFDIFESEKLYCNWGFPIGCYVDRNIERHGACVINQQYGIPDSYYIFNHLNFEIEYRPVDQDGAEAVQAVNWDEAQLVRVSVTPYSIKQVRSADGMITSCSGDIRPVSFPREPGAQMELEIAYTYNVTYKASKIPWSSRWDHLLEATSSSYQVVWFSVVNSLIVVVFLSSILAVAIARILRSNIRCEDDVLYSTDKKQSDRFRWILVQRDVFRALRRGRLLLAGLLGNGSQIVLTTFITLFLACIGLDSLTNRGSLTAACIITYVFLGFPAGYVASRMYRSLGGESWKNVAINTGLLIPSIPFSLFLLLNLFQWSIGGSTPTPVTTIMALLALWFVVMTPLVFLGSYAGFGQEPMTFPVRPSQIPRLIPRRFLCTGRTAGAVVSGILPFGCIFIQLFFILTSIWNHQVYHMFLNLTVVTIILAVTTAEVTVILCYFSLCKEDYCWWWRPFQMGLSTALYVMAYCLYYCRQKLALDGIASVILYLGYSVIMVVPVFFFCGTISFFSCLFFLIKLYSIIDETDEQQMKNSHSNPESSLEHCSLPTDTPGHAELALPDSPTAGMEELATPERLIANELATPVDELGAMGDGRTTTASLSQSQSHDASGQVVGESGGIRSRDASGKVLEGSEKFQNSEEGQSSISTLISQDLPNEKISDRSELLENQQV